MQYIVQLDDESFVKPNGFTGDKDEAVRLPSHEVAHYVGEGFIQTCRDADLIAPDFYRVIEVES